MPDYLETDSPIPGQNYVCISFISPEDIIKQKELFIFNKFMNQRCAEWDKQLEKIFEKLNDKLKPKLKTELVDSLKKEMEFSYEEFKTKFDDFKYKFNDEIDTSFKHISNNRTSIRGVKVRGCYDSYGEAENRAKSLQRTDSSFHVFVGQVGFWLPWDPQADGIQKESYLEEELNTLMTEYKKNEVNRDIFYEEQKRSKMKDSIKEEQNIEEKLQKDDPWIKSKFENVPETVTETNENETLETVTETPEIKTI